jgi:hypothetical protein
MSILTSAFDDYFVFKNSKYKVDMSFDNILRLFEMFNDDTIVKMDKPILAVRMLVEEVKCDSYEETINLFKYLMKEFIGIDVDKQEENQTKTFDFTKDAEIIYASFFSEYHMDLVEMQGILHWNKFIALLNYLDDESKFKQIVGIRTMKVPSSQEASQEYIDHIRKMKDTYSLDEEQKGENINDVFDRLAGVFISNSKGVE